MNNAIIWYAPGADEGKSMTDSSQLLAWQVITAFNVVIEVILLAIPVWLVWGLQTDLRRKFTVVAVFWLRVPYGSSFHMFWTVH